jgi:hypothetical protein
MLVDSMLQITAIVLIAFIVVLTNTINVIAQNQNVTNMTVIGKDQSISGRISGLDKDLQFGR